MTPEQWQQVNLIFDHAADLPPAAQPTAVHELSKGEAAIESEVLRLLQSMQQAGDFLAEPLLDLHALLPDDPLPAPMFVPGAVILDRFHIRRFLASGGMGEVYEAWDNELEEDVALKTIRPQIARHPEVIERFKQEVRNARGISHPNICRVYEIFHMDAPGGERTWFLSMELVHGTTLLDCIHTKGCLPSSDALLIARQMASGLEAAHQYGLVHRDFKSANVMLVEQAGKPNRAVIMDFGLSARMLQADSVDRHATAGTPGYMAPEQERGGTIGPLADQYAFGVVLCEMLSGALPTWKTAKAEGRRRSTFRGLIRPRQIAAPAKAEAHEHPQAGARLEAQENVAVLANKAAQGNAAMHEIVPVQGNPAGQVRALPVEKPRLRLPPHRFSPRAEHVIRRCLDRDPACRFPDMKTAASTLVPPGVLGTPWRKAIAVCFLVLLALGTWRWRVYQSRCRICDVVQLTPDTDQSDEPSLSADGRLIAYSSDRASTGNLDIFLQKLPNGQAIRLTHDPSQDTEPSLSPDGSLLAFRSERSPSGIYLMNTRSGPEKLVALDGHNPQFSPDGKSLLFWSGDLDPAIATGSTYILNLNNGGLERIASSFQDARYPVWSSDGSKILFTGCANQGRVLTDCSDWWISFRDGTRIVQTHAVEALKSHGLLLSRSTTGAWIGDRIVFGGFAGSQRNLWEVRVNPKDWQVHDPPEILSNKNATELNPVFSLDGHIAYTSMTGALHVWRIQEASYSSKPQPELVTDDAEIDGKPTVSENGRFLVFERGRGRRSLVLRDLSTGAESSILDSDNSASSPIIDTTGNWFAYEKPGVDGPEILVRDRSGNSKMICQNCDQPSSWFQGHRGLFYRSAVSEGISLVEVGSGTVHQLLSESGAKLGEANWSSTNGFLLFTITRGSKSQISTVRVDSQSLRAQMPWVAITDENSHTHHPCWSHDGRMIFYVSDKNGSQAIYGQKFSPELGRLLGSPYTLFDPRGARRSIDNVTRNSFQLSAGGGFVYLNLGEQSSTIEFGRTPTKSKFLSLSMANTR